MAAKPPCEHSRQADAAGIFIFRSSEPDHDHRQPLGIRKRIDSLRPTPDQHAVHMQCISSEGVSPMANVVKKHSISSELAQKMVDAAVAKARELGVSENVAILDDGGNLKAFSRMDGAPILCIEMAQNKAYTALFGVSTQDFFD